MDDTAGVLVLWKEVRAAHLASGIYDHLTVSFNIFKS